MPQPSVHNAPVPSGQSTAPADGAADAPASSGQIESPRTDTDDLLDRLLSVFSARGFDGASLQELARASNRSKASLYHHFPGGKQQMIEVLVSRAQNDLNQRAFAPLRDSLSPWTGPNSSKKTTKKRTKAAAAGLAAFVDGFADYLQQHQGNCLLATLALTQPELLGDSHKSHLANWLAALAAACELAGHKPKAARRLAQASLANLYGSLTLSSMGSHVSMAQACKWLKRDLLRAP